MGSISRSDYDDLDSPYSYTELKKILSQVNLEHPASNILFKGKYQVLLLENLLPWQKPIGQFFQTVLAICGVKPKRFLSTIEDSRLDSPSEVFDEDVDADGCPLPVFFDSLLTTDAGYSSSVAVIKRLKEKFHLYPLSQDVGRKLLELCNCIADEYQFPYPVIAMCHGRDPKSVALIGTLKNDKLIQVIVNSHGSVSKLTQLPKLPSVKLAHVSRFSSLYAEIETSVYARYDVLSSETSSDLQPCQHMNVVVECTWSNPETILEPVSSDCSCHAKIKAVAGDEKSGASEKFKEIKLIKALRESLDTGIMEWQNSDTCVDLMQKVVDFMKAETKDLLKKQMMVPPIMDLESFDIVVLGGRKSLDFTDRLWLVLKDCSSCEELKEALSYVLEELSELVDPLYVYPKNSSTIAMSIKNMQDNPVELPSLTSHLASQMLLEIGIEKLRRDYIEIFAGLELVRYDSIDCFLQPGITSHQAVSCLEKLHCVLELAIIGLKCLCLPKLLLSEFVRNVLNYYSAVSDIDLQHVFKFKIPATKARYLLDQMRPTVWEISFLSSDKDFKKQTVHHYSTTPTSDQIYAPKDYHPKLMLKNASYIYMSGTFIEDRFFV